MLLSTAKAVLKHSPKVYRFKSFFAAFPKDPFLSTLRAVGLAHSFRHKCLVNGEVSPLGPKHTHKERDWEKIVATMSFSREGNKVNTINL